MYKRIHTPNSPLLPLSPMVPNGTQLTTTTMALTPIDAIFRNKSRRSFTPALVNRSPPSVSPIHGISMPNKMKSIENLKRLQLSTPSKTFGSSSVQKSVNASMKKVHSSARKDAAKAHMRELMPIRRSLFAEEMEPPIVEVSSPKSPFGAVAMRSTTPKSNQRYQSSPRIFLTPAEQRELVDHLNLLSCSDSTPNVLDQTFTVRSILKEINLKKYVRLFEREEIDLFVFTLLTADDLIELGIEEDDRSILLDTIQNYQELLSNVENNNIE